MLAYCSRALCFCRVCAWLVALSDRSRGVYFLALAVASSGKAADDVFAVIAVVRPFANWLLQQLLLVLFSSLRLVGYRQMPLLRTLREEAVLPPPFNRWPGHDDCWRKGCVGVAWAGGLAMGDWVEVDSHFTRHATRARVMMQLPPMFWLRKASVILGTLFRQHKPEPRGLLGTVAPKLPCLNIIMDTKHWSYSWLQ